MARERSTEACPTSDETIRFYGAKRLVESCERRILSERGAFPKEELCIAVKEFSPVYEEISLSSWLRRDG